MKAAVMEAVRKPLVVKDVQDPSCPANGVIIRSEAEGVCRSDWHAWSGDWSWIGLVPPMPLVMGHEFCGVVEEVGKESKNFKKGDRVLVPFSQGDGVCEYCRAGQSHVCANPMLPGFSYWGGYGHYVGVPNADANLVPMPDDVGFEEGASMGCRFMTSYHGVVDRAQVRPGEWVAVHGCGGIGLSAIHVAAAIGANVIAVDLDDAKLELAKKIGAQHVVNGKKTDAVMAIMDITKGGAHVGVDALGVKATCQNSILSLRKQGRSLQIGLTTAAEKGEVSLPIDRMVTMELSLIASLGMPANRYSSMLQMVNAKKLNPKSMITETISLGGASAVLEQMTTFQNVGVSIINKYTA
ncbi:MAG TPA: zinc-dependent alcohol dehydrogenase family protein [Candidatus Binataceae bacterium]|jgi:D-arabinose 1-dehydrogenase-like Zn-dependent alcohol dehydrogenase